MEGSSNAGHIFENILQGITDSVLLLSIDLEILWANEAFQNQTGYKREEIIGSHCYKLTHHQEVPCQSPHDLCPIVEALENGRTATTTHTHFDKEGNKIFVEVSAYPLKDENGDIIQFVYMYRGITGMKRLEEELRITRDELEVRVKERTKELANVNEELRAEIAERSQAESRINATNALLKLSVKKSSRREYLDSVVKLISDWSGCRCVGIRVLDGYGNIPYESYVGFSNEFWESENWLSLKKDQCACIRVILEKLEPQDLPVVTQAGSFRCDNTTTFISGLSEDEKARYRGVCIRSGFKSVAIIPIRYKDTVVGAVHLADEKEGTVPLKTVEFIESVSPLIGETVYRFSTEEELTKYQEHLEELVEERTAMLKAATEKLQQEITERTKMEEALRKSHGELEIRVKERTSDLEKVNEELMKSYEQLRKLSAHLQSVREEERMNIAREIHDELGQGLTALKIDVSMLANKLYQDSKLFEKTESVIKRIDETIQSVKRICAELRPTILDHFGLSAAIEWQVEEFESRTGIKCDVSFEPREIILDQDLTTSVFRICQEALTNVARHANATEVRISLRLKDGNIRLEVRDNGKGFTEEQFSDPKSFGLIGIRERVNFFGGNVKINGIQDKGTTITVCIPLRDKEEFHDKNINR